MADGPIHNLPQPRPPAPTGGTHWPEERRLTLLPPKRTPVADAILGFDPAERAREEAEKHRFTWMAEKLRRDPTGESLRTLGNEIAEGMNLQLGDAWSRRVLPYENVKEQPLVRKALNVEAFTFEADGGAIDPVSGVREFRPMEFPTLLTRDVETDDLTAKAIQHTTRSIALETRALLEAKENLRVSQIFDRCCVKTEQRVVTHALASKSFFDAIAMVERTGSPVSFITVHRADAANFECELEGFRSEDDPVQRGLGFVGKFDGIDIITPTNVVDDVVQRGCAYVTVAPEAIGLFEEAEAYHFAPYQQLVEAEKEAKKAIGWTIAGSHRLYISNPYGVARINFGKPSARKL